MNITKADGTVEAFDPEKLLSSLRRAGTDRGTAESITEEVSASIFDGIPTNEIYRRAFARVREYKKGAAARYSLKRAILEFGPSGFPFEAYMAELFRAKGYTAAIDQIVRGRCVEHEVDVVLKKGDETVYIEAKFHNTAGFKTDLKTVLYVKARHDDLREKREAEGVKGTMRGLVVTNTKFTTIAEEYANCAGVELLGWDYPQEHDLHELIDETKLYPVTALESLNKKQKVALLQERVVLCNTLPNSSAALARVGIVGKKADKVLEEVGALCVPGKAI